MKLEQSFEVAAPIDRVWGALIDVERVAPCLPGASVTGRNEDGSYAGNLTIKIGPTTAAYAGRLEMEDIDEGSHTATMQAQGTDKRGQGGAKATITSTLSETADGTHVEVSTDYHITGRLARFGRGGMIEDISNRLLPRVRLVPAVLAREQARAGGGAGSVVRGGVERGYGRAGRSELGPRGDVGSHRALRTGRAHVAVPGRHTGCEQRDRRHPADDVRPVGAHEAQSGTARTAVRVPARAHHVAASTPLRLAR